MSSGETRTTLAIIAGVVAAVVWTAAAVVVTYVGFWSSVDISCDGPPRFDPSNGGWLAIAGPLIWAGALVAAAVWVARRSPGRRLLVVSTGVGAACALLLAVLLVTRLLIEPAQLCF